MSHNHVEYWGKTLTEQDKELINNKNQYMSLINQITQLQLSGENPPEELLKQTQEKRRVAEIPEIFWKSIGFGF